MNLFYDPFPHFPTSLHISQAGFGMAIPGLLSIIMSLTCFVSLTMSLEGGAQEPTVITAALTELAMTETKEPWFRVTLDSNIKTESAIAVASVYSSSTWTIPIPRLETNLANSVVVYNHSLPMFPCRNEYVHPQFIHISSLYNYKRFLKSPVIISGYPVIDIEKSLTHF